MIIAQNSGKTANASPENFEVTDFYGHDAVGSPYWFEISFRRSRTAKASKAAPPLRTPIPQIDGVTTAPIGTTRSASPQIRRFWELAGLYGGK